MTPPTRNSPRDNDGDAKRKRVAARIGLILILIADATFLIAAFQLASDDSAARVFTGMLAVGIYMLLVPIPIAAVVHLYGKRWTPFDALTIWGISILQSLIVAALVWFAILNKIAWFPGA